MGKLTSRTTEHFSWLQNLDTQLQRTLNMDDFDTAETIRRRRKEIDEVVAAKLVRTTCNSSLREERGQQQDTFQSVMHTTTAGGNLECGRSKEHFCLCLYHLVVS